MSVKDEQIKYILHKYPNASKDNTEFYLRFLEEACTQRAVSFPEGLKKIMRDFKPEAVTRKRREHSKSSKWQKEQQNKYKSYYAKETNS